MGRKKIPGLVKRGETWHIDKVIGGKRICESTGTADLEEAEWFLGKRLEELRLQKLYGIRPIRTFHIAAEKYLGETVKRSLDRDRYSLKSLEPYIGDLPIEEVHMGTLQKYIKARRQDGVKSSTIARELTLVRRILNLAARAWRDDNNMPWIDTAPLIQMPKWEDASQAYPLTWDEQKRLFKRLPEYLHKMALFKVNTGLREQGVCWLQWDWEVWVPELKTSIFITPGKKIKYPDGVWPGEKNKEDQVVVLNRIARSIIEDQRGQHDDYVFPFEGRRLMRMNNRAWREAWKAAGLPTDGETTKGPHNLKHTFGRRLRAAGIPLETRKALLHHKSGDITTHYSGPELKELIQAVEQICDIDSGVALTVLKRAAR